MSGQNVNDLLVMKGVAEDAHKQAEYGVAKSVALQSAAWSLFACSVMPRRL